MFFSRLSIVYGGSILLHAGVALAVASIHVPERHEPTKISIREVKRPKPVQPSTPAPPVPPPPVAAPAPVKPRAPKPAPQQPAPAAPSAAQPAAASAGASVPDFGLSLGGAVGTGGVAVPAAGPTAAEPLRTTRAPKALTKAHDSAEAGCIEELIKPKPLSVPQPVYPEQARAEGITGKVRVELSVDEQGQVLNARVLEGLGHGLDEAALEAARAAHFEPATRCGKPTKTTFVIGMRFTL
jgi:protein TonB